MEFFAGANSASGFVSVFDSVLSGVERIYILKGSSGCGKSTLMKKIAVRAKSEGLDYDVIRCSADINSLDGVIIKAPSVAIIDGTSPHLLDVKYPCVRESIINLGQFWDERQLLPRKNEIITLSDEKTACYKHAYHRLSICGRIESLKNEILCEFIDYEALDRLIFSLLKGKNKKGEVKTIFTRSFSADGEACLKSFENISAVVAFEGAGFAVFAKRLLHTVKDLSLEAFVSLDPITQLPDSFLIDDWLITSLENYTLAENAKLIRVRTTRFLKSAGVKSKIGLLNRVKGELLVDAQGFLLKARDYHNMLESVFIPCMDFKALDECTNRLMISIFEA